MNLLTAAASNAKTSKNSIVGGFNSYILHLAPSTLSGYNTCAFASKGCAMACLNTAGRGGMFKRGETTNSIQQARIRKTKMFFRQSQLFWQLLIKDLIAVERKSAKLGLKPVVRLNGTSDLPWHKLKVPGTDKTILQLFPTIQFYDYTKRLQTLQEIKLAPIANYYVTFSRSESNADDCHKAIALGFNVAVVFGRELPELWVSRPVVDGDQHDLRFLDLKPADGRGAVVGLKAKGRAKKDMSGFVLLQKSAKRAA